MEVFDFQRARRAGVHDVGQPSIGWLCQANSIFRSKLLYVLAYPSNPGLQLHT
jgi:hypothetical protein